MLFAVQMDVQIPADLDPDVSLVVAHQVVVAAERRILEAFPGADILIHADPHGRAEPHGGEFARDGETREGVPASV